MLEEYNLECKDVNLLCWKGEIIQHAKGTIYLSTWIFVDSVKPCLSVCHSKLAAVCLSPCVHVSVSLIHKKK